jgi:hypothetical protein
VTICWLNQIIFVLTRVHGQADGGERRPSRLVATAEEDRLNI